MENEEQQQPDPMEEDLKAGFKAVNDFFHPMYAVVLRYVDYKEYWDNAMRHLHKYTTPEFQRPDLALELGRLHQARALIEKDYYDVSIRFCEDALERLRDKNRPRVKKIRKRFLDAAENPDLPRDNKLGKSIVLSALSSRFLKILPRKDLLERAISQIEHDTKELKKKRDEGYNKFMQFALREFKVAAAMEECEDTRSPALAKLSIANIYMDETLSVRDELAESMAFQLCVEAAEVGCLEAQVRLAKIFLEGEIVDQDLSGARYWAEEAVGNTVLEKSSDELVKDAHYILQQIAENTVKNTIKPTG